MGIPQYSPDRRWWWNGSSWQSRQGMFWFLKDPNWLVQVVLMSLLGLIPLFGFLFLFGWLLSARDNLRAGNVFVPKASFHYWHRGVEFFVPFLFYTVSWFLLAILLLFSSSLLSRLGIGIDFGLIAFLVVLLLLGLAIFFLYTFGAMLVIADAKGIWATMNLSLVWRTAIQSSASSIRFVGTYMLGVFILSVIGILIPGASTPVSLLLASAVYLMLAPALAEIAIAK